MAFYLLTDTENSYTATRAPAAQDIETRIRQAMVGAGGRLVGDRARITRTGGLTANLSDTLGAVAFGPFGAAALSQPQMATTVAWLVEANGDASAADIARRWDTYLGFLSSDWTGARATPWTSITNEDVAYWQNPHGASETRTRDTFPALTTDPNENPIGATTAATHPTTVAETAQNAAHQAQQTAQSFTPLLVATGIGVAGVLGVYAWIASAPARATVRSGYNRIRGR